MKRTDPNQSGAARVQSKVGCIGYGKRSNRNVSELLQIARLEHEAACVHPAIDFVITADEADPFDFRAHLERDRRTLDLQIFDEHDRISISEDIAVGVSDTRVGMLVVSGTRHDRPFVATIGADIVIAVRICVFQRTLRAGGEVRYGLHLA